MTTHQKLLQLTQLGVQRGPSWCHDLVEGVFVQETLQLRFLCCCLAFLKKKKTKKKNKKQQLEKNTIPQVHEGIFLEEFWTKSQQM